MIHLKRLTLRDKLMEFLFPELRRRRERLVDEALRQLMTHCGDACLIDDVLIPDGYGTPTRKVQ